MLLGAGCQSCTLQGDQGQRTPGKQAFDVQKMTSFILGKSWYILVGKLPILVGQKDFLGIRTIAAFLNRQLNFSPHPGWWLKCSNVISGLE